MVWKNVFALVFLISPLVTPSVAASPMAEDMGDICSPDINSSGMTLLDKNDTGIWKESKDKSKENIVADDQVPNPILQQLGFSDVNSQIAFLQHFINDTKKEYPDIDVSDIELNGLQYFLFSIKTKPEKGLLLEVHQGGTWDYFYYFFAKKGNRYFLVTPQGQTVMNKYCKSSPGFFTFAGQDYFSFIDTSGGSGESEASEEVVSLDKGQFKDVLIYPIQGHSVEGGPYGYEYEASPVEFVQDPHGSYARYSLPITFVSILCPENHDDNYHDVFSKTYNVYYTRDEKTGSFIYDANRSGLPQDPMEHIPGDYDDNFVQTFYPELQTIATKGDTFHKEWLKCFLMDIDPKKTDVKKQKELLDLLNKR